MIGKIIKGRRIIGVIAALGSDLHTIKHAVYQENLKIGRQHPHPCMVWVKDIQEPTENEINLYKRYLVKFGYIYSNGDIVKNEEF